MSAVDDLREAAKLLRQRAEAASKGAWPAPERDDNPGDEGWWVFNGLVGMREHAVACVPLYNPTAEADATYIASVHPLVGLALAAALEAEATLMARSACECDDHAHFARLARTYLGRSS